ncbi:TetR/AcrR family transcriptional regulator [Hahella aquimaris]|uniref:TetR/AcrR family transcriptional regulator n=1 Tax=Hahella sp. HNIBRBA332 TaxID=3015983 RepID=UPI00273B5AB9|nr:TetR/AcrR family transcriptional regulator [Hahella sp. HNIBRBA332]WLQ12247.1 TetR/AcrR family transcriptional regulator [Hahella sp. HNIBRBA332]
MNTREKIILASLDLFNERGERNVTTNHIASHLSISPGNLYYHFRNKTDIIYEIFLQYQLLVDHYLQAPEGRPLTVEDQFDYLESVFDGLWSYRFFHRDLEHYLESDERLKADYRKFTQRCIGSVVNIIYGMELSGILRPVSDHLRRSLALNVWLVVTNWMSFLKTAAGEESALIRKDTLKHGIYQVICLEAPYLQPAFYDEVTGLQQNYSPSVLNDLGL